MQKKHILNWVTKKKKQPSYDPLLNEQTEL